MVVYVYVDYVYVYAHMQIHTHAYIYMGGSWMHPTQSRSKKERNTEVATSRPGADGLAIAQVLWVGGRWI